ncbi:SGNH/GDSL hydrolase family protein [Spiroplasma culicicola]|uniref:Lipolytic enzyme, GDSL family n=1 Tax=Spiroplasma culicicola AES-1 TaxID=1276246 RepID=W6A7H9_9MOLU|nr:SGNH/GDSL hydrolase family protein [Spiroplasma culicicola]AHI52942.1 lipolytic enzyme, GDSL family [Spiroplasma culicicola AES-1]
MKKLLVLLANLALVAATTTSLVACTIKNAPQIDPLTIGKNIKKLDDATYAPETPSDSGFTNYFIVGDSLSDDNGLTTLINQKFSQTLLVPFPELGVELPPAIEKILKLILIDGKIAVRSNINFNFASTEPEKGVGGYGYYDEKQVFHSNFSNGPTAGVELNNLLGFEEIKSSNKFSDPYNMGNIKPKYEYGRNYSIGGATGSSVKDVTSILLNDVTIDKQAEALVSQHHIEDSTNDLVFLEIGGNDLFALAELKDDRKAQTRLLTEAMEKIKIALFTLLNNGIENVIVGTPPDVSVVPRYVEDSNQNNDKFKYIQQISKEFNQMMLDTVKYVQNFYSSNIKIYDIYSDFENLQNEHEQLMIEKGIIDPNKGEKTEKKYAFTDSAAANLEKLNACATLLNQDLSCFDIKELLPSGDNQIKDVMSYLEYSELVTNNIQNRALFTGISLNIEANMQTYRSIAENGDDMPDIDSYFFTDFVHPTKYVHEIVAEKLEELAKQFNS